MRLSFFNIRYKRSDVRFSSTLPGKILFKGSLWGNYFKKWHKKNIKLEFFKTTRTSIWEMNVCRYSPIQHLFFLLKIKTRKKVVDFVYLSEDYLKLVNFFYQVEHWFKFKSLEKYVFQKKISYFIFMLVFFFFFC